MFDMGGNSKLEEIKEMKYQYIVLPEYTKKEMLSMEKEMLGLYISGHPLENIRTQIEAKTNINTMMLRQLMQTNLEDEENLDLEQNQTRLGLKDGQSVTYAGIISSVKKKYTKNNKLMAFITVEDLYGQAEIIVFDNCYQACSNILVNDNIIIVDGKLSIREDEEPKIVARIISEFTEVKKKIFKLNITNLSEITREKLKGAIYFFSGEKNNMQIQIQNGEKIDATKTGIYMTPEILKQFQELVGEENASIIESV